MSELSTELKQRDDAQRKTLKVTLVAAIIAAIATLISAGVGWFNSKTHSPSAASSPIQSQPR
jgi:putative Mn2+ efflux pump MntP